MNRLKINLWAVFRGHPVATIGLVGVTFFILLAIFGPLIAPQTRMIKQGWIFWMVSYHQCLSWVTEPFL